MKILFFLLAQLFLAVALAGRSGTTLLGNGENIVEHFKFAGSPKWKLFPLLWTDKSVNVTCKFTKDFKVYTAPTLQALSDKIERKESVWCGWHNFLGQHSCVARLSPFGSVHVGVVHSNIPSKQCEIQLEERLSLFLIGQTILGALLFLNANRLSASVFFRLGTGSAGVMLLSVLILLFLLSRTLPSKKSAAAMFAIFGSSFTGMVRYAFGQWIPSFEQLIYSKIVLGYLTVSGLVGLATTYYFDRDDNVKLHNILKYGLKLAGLLMIVFSTSMPEASVALCCLLVATQLLEPVSYLWRKGKVDVQTLSDMTLEAPTYHQRQQASSKIDGQGGESSDSELETALETQQDEDEDELTPSSEESSEAAVLRASKTPFPGESRQDVAGPSDNRNSPATPPVMMPIGQAPDDSPWLKQGLALNVDTGRTVKTGGSTWNKLVMQGYQLDRQQGTLTPPAAKLRRATASQQTPASRVKARRTSALE